MEPICRRIYNPKKHLTPKPIKIFLASSKDLIEERDGIDLVISSFNRKYLNKKISFEVIRWEEKNQSFNGDRKQEDFNQIMLKCDVVLVLIGNKIGKYNFSFSTKYN